MDSYCLISVLCLWILPPMLQKCNSILLFPLWRESMRMFPGSSHWFSRIFLWRIHKIFYVKNPFLFKNGKKILVMNRRLSSVKAIANHWKNRISDALSASLLNPVFTGWCFLHFITQFMCWINSNSQSILNATELASGPNASQEGLS